MNGNCHFLFGASVSVALVINLDTISNTLVHISSNQDNVTLLMLGGIVGGIFPDIDNPTSYMGRLSAPISTMIGKIGECFNKVGANHRGILHDPIIYLCGLYVAYMYCPSLIGFFIGCLSHLLLDMFNPSGVPFLFGLKRLHLGKIKSGSQESVKLTWLMVILVLVVSVAFKYGLFNDIIYK